MKFCLINDGDCRWFICPTDKRNEAVKILETILDYWDVGDYDKFCPKTPNYLIAIDSPQEISFNSYEFMFD